MPKILQRRLNTQVCTNTTYGVQFRMYTVLFVGLITFKHVFPAEDTLHDNRSTGIFNLVCSFVSVVHVWESIGNDAFNNPLIVLQQQASAGQLPSGTIVGSCETCGEDLNSLCFQFLYSPIEKLSKLDTFTNRLGIRLGNTCQIKLYDVCTGARKKCSRGLSVL